MVVALTLDTWISIGTVVAGLVGLYRALRRDTGARVAALTGEMREMREMRAELKGEIAGVRTELKGDIAGVRAEIAGLRTELKGDIDRLDSRLTGEIHRVDDRVYALGAGLKPLIEQAQATAGQASA